MLFQKTVRTFVNENFNVMKLKRYIFIFLLFPAVLMPANAQTKPAAEPFVSVSQVDGVLKIKANKENAKIFVYSILGNLVAEKKLAGSQEEIQLNLPKGYYIVKVNENVQKIIVR